MAVGIPGSIDNSIEFALEGDEGGIRELAPVAALELFTRYFVTGVLVASSCSGVPFARLTL
ncbi:hypothetical protein [Bradyrhizobium ottawaense]|uniref:hypothetical protein n=1 Tax=Bradyrhizobium ottawaense TaxID=931866 RepID=UPI003F9F0F31